MEITLLLKIKFQVACMVNKRMCRVTILALLFSSNCFANIIIDTKNVDQEKYHADMFECQQYSQQVQHQQVESTGKSALGSTARGAALGAAGVAIAGGSGSEGAKVGAGIGLVSGLASHHRAKEQSEIAYSAEVEQVIKHCMASRGYTVLN